MNSEQQKILKQLAQMGETVLVQKDGSRFLLNEEGKIPLETHEDAVLYFMQRLDDDMLNLILEDHFTYQEFDKKTFINKLYYAFQEFLEKGNTYLNIFEGKCYSCSAKKENCKGFSFVGNKTNHYMDLMIEIKDNKVSDIYECRNFVNENPAVFKGIKVTIDKDNVPF